MLVRPTGKWINSIVVPNCGIIRKPFNSEFADVSDSAGKWLMESGFAMPTEDVEAIELLSAQTEEALPLLATEDSAESAKPKKSSRSFTSPES